MQICISFPPSKRGTSKGAEHRKVGRQEKPPICPMLPRHPVVTKNILLTFYLPPQNRRNMSKESIIRNVFSLLNFMELPSISVQNNRFSSGIFIHAWSVFSTPGARLCTELREFRACSGRPAARTIPFRCVKGPAGLPWATSFPTYSSLLSSTSGRPLRSP